MLQTYSRRLLLPNPTQKHIRTLILGIESSCDDSGAAIINPENKQIVAEALATQSSAKLGGVNPTLAMKAHAQAVPKTVKEVLDKATMEAIEAIAVTNRPGLKGSLIIGRNYAQYLCHKFKKPMIPIHHMEAHALTPRLTNDLEFPYLAFLISGGHCMLALAQDFDTFLLLGTSGDNAPGEVIDKAARRLRLHNRPDLANRSGGYAIQTVGKNGDPHRFQFKETLLNERSCMFSFSSHRSQFEKKIGELDSKDLLDNETVVSDFCASVEFSIGTVLTRRLLRSIEFLNRKELWGNDNCRPKSIAVSGGVACNQRIRSMINHACKVSDCEAVFPPPQYCTDNGVMIAWNGVEKWQKNADLIPWNRVFDVNVQPRVPFGLNRTQDVIDAHIPNRKINFDDL